MLPYFQVRFWRKFGVAVIALLTFVNPSAASQEGAAGNGMVVSAQHLASDVGVDILRAGGNAVDAAVAVGYAEAVVNPCCGNIGGGGFMLLHLTGNRNVVINFRETAPAAADADMYLDAAGNPIANASLLGFKAVAVPGSVHGLDEALRHYGRLTRAQVMAPAIRLARDGFVLTKGDTDILGPLTGQFQRDPELSRIFLRPDGSPLQPGDRLVQKDLAGTLQQIADLGPTYFYTGAFARQLAAASVSGGGILRAGDLARYHAEQMAPLHCTYRGYEFLTIPPPSSGGVSLCEILNILEGYDLKGLGFHSVEATRLMAEAMRYAYADRNNSLGDPDFIHNPVPHLLSKDYAAAIRRRIASAALAPVAAWPADEKPETTHYSIVDKDGDAASVTYTLNGSFGALVMVPGTGVVLNDEMDDFTTKPGVANQFGLVQGRDNAIAPNKRPLSSMSPTIILKDGRPFLVLGSPGGSRIITATLEAAINVIDYAMAPQAAVDAPRIHYQGQPDTLFVEPGALSPDVRVALEGRGYHVQEQAPWCAVELVQITGRFKQVKLSGANDSRRPAGGARGY